MQETLHGHYTFISIGGRSICSLRSTDDIELMDGSSDEFQDLTNRLVDRARTHGMEVSTEKSKIMTNSTNNISADITMNGQTLGDQFQVPGSNPVQRWHLLSRSPHQYYLGYGSNA